MTFKFNLLDTVIVKAGAFKGHTGTVIKRAITPTAYTYLVKFFWPILGPDTYGGKAYYKECQFYEEELDKLPPDDNWYAHLPESPYPPAPEYKHKQPEFHV